MRFNLVSLSVMLGFTLEAFSLPFTPSNPVFNPILLEKQPIRSENTCADPSLTRVLYQGFSAPATAHSLNFIFAFADSDSVTSSYLWTLQGAAFRAWATQQPFTVPLFRLGNPSGQAGSDYAFLVGANTQTPPALSGFQTDASDIVAWVYNSPVCGSVPLMSAVLTSRTDHYYTIDPDEHADLLALPSGWVDNGIVAYVLPV